MKNQAQPTLAGAKGGSGLLELGTTARSALDRLRGSWRAEGRSRVHRSPGSFAPANLQVGSSSSLVVLHEDFQIGFRAGIATQQRPIRRWMALPSSQAL